MFPSRLVSVLGKGALENNYALEFDGSNDRVKIDSVIGDLGSSATFSAWIYRANTDGYHYFFDARNNSGAGFVQGNSGNTTINKSSGTVYVDGVASSTLATGGWHHLAITGMTINITQDLMIGVHLGGSAFSFPGKMDEYAIWNTSLSAGDISALYQARGTADLNDDGNSANLVGWWRMGDGDTFPTITDNSTNSNDGTMTNMTASDIVKDTP